MKEEEIERRLEKNLKSIEPGLRLIERQKRTNLGIIDLFCKDKKDNYVIIEIKKKPTTKVITQLAKYNMALIKKGISSKRLRTILIAQEISKPVEEICKFFNFEVKSLYKETNKQVKLKKSKYKKSKVTFLLGEVPHIRILNFLIEGRHFDYTLTDLANNAGVSWGTLHSIFPKLIKYNIVKKVREIGRAKLYKINTENKIAIQLIDLYDSISLINLKTLEEKQRIPA